MNILTPAQQAAPRTSKRFFVLDSFRGICALLVVCYHLKISNSFLEYELFLNSSYFVAFFFVLSGFVLTHTYLHREVKIKDFFISRTFRILPLHVFMLIVFISLELLKLFLYHRGLDFNNVPFTGVNSPNQILPNLFLVQAWTTLTEALSFNPPSWSISIEYYLYFIFAFTLVAIGGRGRTLAWIAIIALTALITYNAHMYLITPMAIKGILCFFSGSVTYLAYERLKKYTLGFLVSSCVEVMLITACYVVVVSSAQQKDLYSVAIFCVTVLAFSFESGAISKALNTKPLHYIGDRSYSIYLTHGATLFIFTSLFYVYEKVAGNKITSLIGPVRYINTNNNMINNSIALFIIIFVIASSSITYRFIEMRFNSIGRSLSKRGPLLAR